MPFIYHLSNNKHIEVEIVQAEGKTLIKKAKWKFHWDKLINEKNSKTFVLRLKGTKIIEGILQLKIENDMLIMNALEIAPHNIGTLNKKFDNVAGCLIAFACRESFKIEGAYKGFLTFISKTSLIEWYKEKHGATQALGSRMYIDDKSGLKLIKKYLVLS